MEIIKNYSKSLENIRYHLKDYIVKNNLNSLILGISGGIDSTLVAAISRPVCDELGIELIGRSITIDSNKKDEIERSKIVGESFCTNFSELDLTKEFEIMKNFDIIENNTGNDISMRIRMGNIKARMRMIYLYNLASANRGIVLSTDNYTEYLLGFWTLNGDVGDYSMIQNLWKTEVYEMSEWILKNEAKNDKEKTAIKYCIDANATDGLGVSNTDLDQILPSWAGSSREGYKEVDRILINYTENKFYENNAVIDRHKRTEFKRNNPFMLPREMII